VDAGKNQRHLRSIYTRISDIAAITVLLFPSFFVAAIGVQSVPTFVLTLISYTLVMRAILFFPCLVFITSYFFYTDAQPANESFHHGGSHQGGTRGNV
jgi:ABC-type bacteriocin/lantibiotic exporter with double-glycine peptidase domain